MNEFITRYLAFEDVMVSDLNSLDFYKQKQHTLDDKAYCGHLIQLGHFSFQFINWLQLALISISNPAGKKVIRHLLQEEVPVGGQTHQEDRMDDFDRIGITTSEALRTPASEATHSSITRRFEIIGEVMERDLRTLVTLRLDGEIFASETFRDVVIQLQRRFGIKPGELKYYTPHFEHDRRGTDSPGSHSEAYTKVLDTIITTESKLEAAQQFAIEALEIRKIFYSQF